MRWPRSVFADSLEELTHEAELHFAPGTAYSIYSIREESDPDRVTYRADALPPRSPGSPRTRSTARDGRTRVGRNLGHDAGPQPEPPGRRTTGGATGGATGETGGTGRTAGYGGLGPTAGQSIERRRATGTVGAINPETVAEIPGWSPEPIPASALQAGPGLQAAYGLLMDGSGPAAEAARTPGSEPAAPGEAPDPAPRGAEAERRGERAGVVPWFSTEDPDLHAMLDHAAPDQTGPDAPLDSSGRRRTRLVFAGLLDDAVEAAERTGHRRWSAAGVLNGGRPGATVVCYGLGDGSDVGTLARGLHRYAPMHLVLAVDPSRKHADTQAWVRQVAEAIQPASYVAVPRTVTGTPATVRDLGYRLHTPSEAAEILRR